VNNKFNTNWGKTVWHVYYSLKIWVDIKRLKIIQSRSKPSVWVKIFLNALKIAMKCKTSPSPIIHSNQGNIITLNLQLLRICFYLVLGYDNKQDNSDTTSPSPCTKPHFTWQVQKFYATGLDVFESQIHGEVDIHYVWYLFTMTSLIIYKPVCSMLLAKCPNDIFLLYLYSVTAITEFWNIFPSPCRQTKPSFITVYLITLIICSITMARASKVAHHYNISHKKRQTFLPKLSKSLNCTLRLKAVHLTNINIALPSTLLQQHS